MHYVRAVIVWCIMDKLSFSKALFFLKNNKLKKPAGIK